MTCELAGFRIPCGGPIQRGHVLSKSKIRGNKRAAAVLEKWPEVFFAAECANHNVSRYADTKDAVDILVSARVYRLGEEYVREALWELAQCFKADRNRFSLDALRRRANTVSKSAQKTV